MEFDQYFERYLTEKMTDLTEETKVIFSQKLPKSVFEEYNVEEVALEFLGHHETAHKYDDIEEFRQILIDYNLPLYLEVKEYCIESLVKYYCFKDNAEKVQLYLKDLIVYDYDDYDLVLSIIYQVIFYGYTNEVDSVIELLYKKVKNDTNLIEGASVDFTLFKFSIELEKVYHQYEETKNSPDWNALQEVMDNYDFTFPDEFRSSLERGMLHSGENIREELLSTFPKEKQATLATIQLIFMKDMLQKGCAFIVSAMFWNYLVGYWASGKAKNWEQFFGFDKKRFTRYIQDKQGMMVDYRNHAVLILWGSTYALEFLRKIELFSEEVYQQQLSIINQIKEEFRQANNVDLWKYSFIFQWQPPNKQVVDAYAQEKALFEASFDLTIEDSTGVHFGEQTPLFGGLKKLMEGEAEWSLGEQEKPKKREMPQRPIAPERRSHNYRRNDRVTVKYTDGTIKEKVKFKTVQDDFELGKCEVV